MTISSKQQQIINNALHRFNLETVLNVVQTLDAGVWKNRDTIQDLLEVTQVNGQAAVLDAIKDSLQKRSQSLQQQIEQVNKTINELIEPQSQAVCNRANAQKNDPTDRRK